MTNIKVDVGELMSLSTRSEGVNSEVKDTFSGIKSSLDNVSWAVNSDTLTGSNDALKGEIESLMKSIDANLNIVKNFLDEQVKNYTVEVDEALNSLRNLISKIDSALITVASGVQNSGSSNYTIEANEYNANQVAENSSTIDGINNYASKPELGFNVTTGNQTYELNDEDFDLLCSIVAAESDRSADDALAVVSTILNRCSDPAWKAYGGNDPMKQAKAKSQFVVYEHGTYKKFLNGNYSDNVKNAVISALNGTRNHEYTCFRANGTGTTILGYNVYKITDRGNRYFRKMSG